MTGFYSIRRALHISAAPIADTAKQNENASTLEFLKSGGNCVGITNWSPESQQSFHDARAALQEHRQIVDGLAWELNQDKEYY